MADLHAKYTQITHEKHASKILRELLHAPQLHVNCMYFGKGRNLLSVSKQNYLRKRTAVMINSKVKQVIARRKKRKQTSFTRLNVFHEVLLKSTEAVC